MTTSTSGTNVAVEVAPQKHKIAQVYSNMYTGLLALTTLALVGTAAYVCLRAWQMYGQIFLVE